MAHPMGFYAKHGLDVEVIKTAGWAVIRDKTLNKEYDAAHMLSPMPIAITLGAGSTPIPYTKIGRASCREQAMILVVEDKEKRDPKSEGRLHPDHLRHADHHGTSHGLLCQARPRCGSDQDRWLGSDPRQDAQQGIRRRTHALADADRDHARRRLDADPLHQDRKSVV